VIDVSRFWQFPVEDELVVARPGLEGLFLFNSTARLLWEERSRGASVAEAVRRFADLFGVPPALAQRDIEGLLADWSAGILAPLKKSAPADGPAAAAEVVPIDCLVNGKRFRVLLDAGDLVEEIAPRLAGLSVTFAPGQSPDVVFTLANGPDRVFVFRDGGLIATEEKTAGARAILLQEMTRACESSRMVRMVRAILHAGACGTDTASVLLAGASYSGKSTLCAALVARGLRCYADDSAVIDENFRVAGMPFPLTLRKSAWPALEGLIGREQLRAHTRWGVEAGFLDSNLPAGSSPAAPVEALLFVNYQAHAATVMEPLTVFETLLRLRRSGFWIEHTRTDIARFLESLTCLPRFTLTYSRLNEAADAVADLLAF
jgi:hypothetical protein